MVRSQDFSPSKVRSAKILHLWQKPGFWQKLCNKGYIVRQKPGFSQFVENAG